ncbi:tubulin monoglutamylase TTLL4-like [Oscarella lobularis]|uniref:tubulin monoglutamylase TTLL4-like n=1 Tax=Oscarella lobularis TaxID=121494 RepID=UPI00331371BE
METATRISFGRTKQDECGIEFQATRNPFSRVLVVIRRLPFAKRLRHNNREITTIRASPPRVRSNATKREKETFDRSIMNDGRRSLLTVGNLRWQSSQTKPVALGHQITLSVIPSRGLVIQPSTTAYSRAALRSGADPSFADALKQRLADLTTISRARASEQLSSSGVTTIASDTEEEDEKTMSPIEIECEDYSDESSVDLELELDEEDEKEVEELRRTRTASSFTRCRLKGGSKDVIGRGKSLSPTALAELEHTSSALRPSLFPNCKPTIHFAVEGEKLTKLPRSVLKLFKWKMSSITPNIVKNCLARSGFKATKRSDDWLGSWGKHMNATAFRAVQSHQKVNHFPGSFEIGRKDKLWRNLVRMQIRFGKKEYDFFPQTFILPNDSRTLRQEFERLGGKQKWIIKPPAAARGIGIRVVDKWSQIPKRKQVIVQKYLDRPFLVNGSKFDLRVYVYVSSYDPLRIYVFDDGLTRFATCKYSAAAKSLSNRFIHLTNYSVNKKNDAFVSNSDETVCQGHKWGLKAFWEYLRADGIDVDCLWESIKDVIVKTIISGEAPVNSLMKTYVKRKWSCHELFGFDIMLDRNLKPWVLEVNISPSLHSTSRLDKNIKGQMVRDILNMAGFELPPEAKSVPEVSSCVPSRISYSLEPHERLKHIFYQQKHLDSASLRTILDVLTPDDVRILIESEDEFARRGRFECVFPTPTTHKYLGFLEVPRYYNVLLAEWVRHYKSFSSKGVDRLISYAVKSVHLQAVAGSDHRWVESLRRWASSAPGNPSARSDATRCRPKTSLATTRGKTTKSHLPEISRRNGEKDKVPIKVKSCTSDHGHHLGQPNRL